MRSLTCCLTDCPLTQYARSALFMHACITAHAQWRPMWSVVASVCSRVRRGPVGLPAASHRAMLSSAISLSLASDSASAQSLVAFSCAPQASGQVTALVVDWSPAQSGALQSAQGHQGVR